MGKAIELEAGTVCVIVRLQKQPDLNGKKCTVKSGYDGSSGRVAVVLVCDGNRRYLLLKRENLHVSLIDRNEGTLTSQERSLLDGKEAAQEHMAGNTIDHVKGFNEMYKDVLRRLEDAITCRDSGRLDQAETLIEGLLEEGEELCGKKSVLVATFVKSYGLLRMHQERFREAEDLFARADALRPADCSHNAQGTHTLQHLFGAQLQRRRIDAAEGTLHRIRILERHIRRGVDVSLDELEEQLAMAKANPQQCAACGIPLTTPLYCARCRVAAFCSRGCQKASWKIHRLICKKSIAADGGSKSSLPTPPIETESTNRITSPASSLDPLTAAVFRNSNATDEVSPSSPTELCTPLITALADPLQAYFFCMNEVTSSSLLERDGGRRRFLATTGVLTCITVFAWSPPLVSGGLGCCFGGHVSLGALLRGIRACNITKQDTNCALAPFVSELRRCFAGKSARKLVLTLVGSHRVMDVSEGLVHMFPGDSDKWSFAWHVKAACKAALDSVTDSVAWDTKLLMRFEGESIKDSATEERVRMKNMNFVVVALDTTTGHIFTQTQYADIDTLLPADILRRQRNVYKPDLALGNPFFSDPKMRLVSHRDEDC